MQHTRSKRRSGGTGSQGVVYTAIRTFWNSLLLLPYIPPLSELSGTPKPLPNAPSSTEQRLVINQHASTTTNRQPQTMRYFLLHKPRGCITSTVDDTGRGRPTVYDVAKAAGVPAFGPVGRLDFDTSGALIFTDDYKLKKAISSPTYKGLAKVGTVPSMEKVYHALIAGTVTPDEKGVRQLREPLHFSRKLDGPGGSWTKPAEARVLLTKTYVPGQSVPWRFKPGSTATITWIEVVLREGKNRQIRRLCRRSEFELTRLHRVSVGPIVLGDLKEGHSRELSRREVEALYKRCLPLDPLCPTVAEIQDALTFRLRQTARRLQEASELAGSQCSESNTRPRGPSSRIAKFRETGKVEETGAGVAVGGNGGDDDGGCAEASRKHTGAGMGDAESLESIVRTLIDFSRRDLHETPPGPAGESAGPEYCPGEEESLAQARAVPPNVAHMTDGYRCSRIEKLGLTYKSM